MSDPRVRLRTPRQVPRAVPFAPLGHHLVNAGLITTRQLRTALRAQRSQHAPLGEILVASGALQRADLCAALAHQFDADFVDLPATAPKGLSGSLSAALCIKHLVVPYRWLGDTLLVATARPERFEALREDAARKGLRLLPVIALPDQIRARLQSDYGPLLAQRAMMRTPERLSCRGWTRQTRQRTLWFASACTPLALCLALWPVQAIAGLSLLAVVFLLLATGLRLAAYLALKRAAPVPPAPPNHPARRVSYRTHRDRSD